MKGSDTPNAGFLYSDIKIYPIIIEDSIFQKSLLRGFHKPAQLVRAPLVKNSDNKNGNLYTFLVCFINLKQRSDTSKAGVLCSNIRCIPNLVVDSMCQKPLLRGFPRPAWLDSAPLMKFLITFIFFCKMIHTYLVRFINFKQGSDTPKAGVLYFNISFIPNLLFQSKC